MRKLQLSLVFLLSSFITFGQEAPVDSTKKPPSDSIQISVMGMEYGNFPFLKTTPPSPEAAAIGKYGALPVTLHSGTTSLKVPFHTLQSGGLQVPVGLSYHSAAMKVSDISSSVGMGWSLQAGGVITRVLKGNKADEDGSNGFLNKPIPSSSNTEDYGCFKGQIDDGTVDGLGDDFYYNFNGRSGRFKYSNYTNTGVWQNSETPILMPDEAIKIEWLSIHKRFKITDEQGIIYIFGLSLANEIAYEQTTTSNNISLNSNSYVSSWFLTEMVSANRVDTIRFKYSSPSLSLQPTTISSTLTRTLLSGSAVPTYEYHNGQRNQSIQAVNLTSIETKNGKIILEYLADRQDTRSLDKRLRSLVLYDGANAALKKLELTQTYYACADGRSQVESQGNNPVVHPVSSYLRKRLRLDAAEYKSGSGLAASNYSFEYNQNESLPIYGALAQDFWGYYNGASGNKNLLIKDIANVNDFLPLVQNGANRIPDFNKSLLGSLKKINYPTGGYTEIIYEENRHPISNIAGGGLRVKRLTDYDAAGKHTARTFNYTSGYYTSNLFSGNYTSLSSETSRTFESQHTCPTTNNNTQTSYRESFIHSIGTSSGSGISYNVIEEIPIDITSSVIKGKTVYEYPTVQDYTVPIYPFVQDLRGWRRGLLEKKTIYKGLTGSFIPLSEEVNTYTRTTLTNVSVGFLARLSHDNISSGLVCGLWRPLTVYCNMYDKLDIYDSFEYTETGESILRTQTVYKTYDENGTNPVTVTQLYEYANLEHLQPTKNTTYRSNGATVEKVLKYPHELSPGSSVYAGMVARHIYAPAIEEEWYEGGIYLKSSRTNQKLWYSTTTFGDVSGFYAPISVEEKYAGGNWRKLVSMGEKLENPLTPGFDLRARPVLYTLQSGLTTSLNYYDSVGKKDQLQSQTQNGQTSTYDYESLVGLKTQTIPNGLSITYDYDYFQRLALISDNQNYITDRFLYSYATTTTGPPVLSNLQWDATRNTCSNTDGINSVFQVFVTGIGTAASVEFSIDGSNWFVANNGADSYQVSVPYNAGGGQYFAARPSDDPVGGIITGSLSKCAYSAGVSAPTISISSSTLCNVNLLATNCTGTVTWSNSSTGTSITVSSATSTAYSATCTVGSTTSLASNVLHIPTLPSTWSTTDIGSATTACTQAVNGDLTLKSNGSLGGSSPDNIHYVYRSMSGDFTIIAKVNALTADDGDRAGIMIRSDLGTQAPDFSLFQDGNTYVGTFHRLSQNADNLFGSFQQGTLNATWLKVVKTGNNFAYYYSTNADPETNNAWQNGFSIVNGTNPQPVTLGSTYLLGFATWGNATQATFSDITINGQAF